MTEHPILFSGPMVNAILEGRKTQTRRIVTPQPDFIDGIYDDRLACFHQVGFHLWVREMLRRPDGDPWLYAADSQPVMVAKADETAMLTWAHHKQKDYCPSIFMPRWASRITLEITDVRLQRLQEISEEDAKAEGIDADSPMTKADIDSLDLGSIERALAESLGPGGHFTAKFNYSILWDSINGKRAPWASNPWVWALTFKRVEIGNA